MKYCSFYREDRKSFGCELRPGFLIDLIQAGSHLVEIGDLPASISGIFRVSSLKDWLHLGREAFEVAHQMRLMISGSDDFSTIPGVFPRNRVRLVAPIAQPGKILAIGLNYRDHAEEQNADLPEKPIVFAKFPSAVIGPDEPIRIPSITQKADPEAELAVVILQRCKHISREKARQAAAFMVANDVSARDLQYSDKQWVRGKSCDTFAPCGPFIVTVDEIGDPHNLQIQLKRNDSIQQSSNTCQMIFDSYQLIEFITQSITLEPGDVILTGTPSGVGVFRNPPVFLKAGDLVEVAIEKLGTLRNPVVADI
jgi:2-keto-4-pentenoate hydratase/2-oxohepta-3-ene-1,7-dioic acid hydratase in catechol pathway